jgi:hypothetical protein
VSDFPTEEAVFEPKRIQVFGVLHMVFGGLGLAGTLGSVVMMQFQSAMLKMTPTAPGMEDYTRISLLVAEKLRPLTYIGAFFGLVLGILLLLAGISLVKRRASALKLSNGYAWTSLALKVVGLLLFFLVTKPLLDSLIDPAMAAAEGMARTQFTILKFSNAIGGILTPFLGAIYPIITLVMLNKPMVRQHLK